MPTSRKHKKSNTKHARSKLLAGIPGRVVNMAPSDWNDAQKARWCRSYMSGLTGKNFADEKRRQGDKFVPAAHRLGARDMSKGGTQCQNDAAQYEEFRQTKANKSFAVPSRHEMTHTDFFVPAFNEYLFGGR